ncbi:MAG: hypothetical protein D6732_18625 [Methanobacteriota archaeon]|nr:MAG: hypothetical protein D6732_18625 [Euryarchaeota archaeon]
MVFETLSFVAGFFLFISVIRTVQLFYLTRIGDYLIFALVNLALIVNSVFLVLFGFSTLLSSISGVVVLNLLFLLFIRVTNKEAVVFQILIMNFLNIAYIGIALYESFVDPRFALFRMFVFNFMLFFIGVAGYSNFVKSSIVESRFKKTGYVIWSLMTLMFAFAAALRMFSILILFWENTPRTQLFFGLMVDIIRLLIFLYSCALLYFSIRNPEFIVLTHQQVIRALKTLRKVSELDLLENDDKGNVEKDPEKLLAYIHQVSKIIRKE